jgi:hypothetical protein
VWLAVVVLPLYVTIDYLKSMTIQLSKKYDVRGIEGMTLHTILGALADAERMYKKAGLTGMAENAAKAYDVLLTTTTETNKNGQPH